MQRGGEGGREELAFETQTKRKRKSTIWSILQGSARVSAVLFFGEACVAAFLQISQREKGLRKAVICGLVGLVGLALQTFRQADELNRTPHQRERD